MKTHRPAYQLQIDFGSVVGIKKSSAQITEHYNLETLLNRQVMAVVNFPSRQIADFMSEVLVLGFMDENNSVVLAGVDQDIPNGQRLC